jgi:hypothetical protein
MPEPEEPSEERTPQNAWTSRNEEEEAMEVTLTPGELCGLARARDKLNARLTFAIVAVAMALAAGLLYNVYRIDQPWIRLGQAWTLGAIVYLLAPGFDRGSRRMGPGEPCARFLERHHQERRRGYLRIRQRLFLFIPGIVACWWGGGPMAAAKSRGLAASSWLSQFLSGPWVFLLVAAALVLVCFAFGKAAEKAEQDREDLLRKMGS